MRKGEGLLRTRSFLLAGLVSFLLAASVHGYGGTIKVTRPPADAESKRLTDLRAGKWLRAPVKDAPSKRGLVKASRKKLPQGFARQYQNVLRLCAIRVEFESVPDPSKISGNADNPGRFDLSDKRSTVFIDPPPHNRRPKSAPLSGRRQSALSE